MNYRPGPVACLAYQTHFQVAPRLIVFCRKSSGREVDRIGDVPIPEFSRFPHIDDDTAAAFLSGKGVAIGNVPYFVVHDGHFETCRAIWQKPEQQSDQRNNCFSNEINQGEKGQACEANNALLRFVFLNLYFLLCEILFHDGEFFGV